MPCSSHFVKGIFHENCHRHVPLHNTRALTWILVTPVTLFDCANKLDQKLFMQFFQASMVLKVLYTATVCHMCPQMCVTGVTVCVPPGTLNTIN